MMRMVAKLTFIDLFLGIGGFRWLGMKQAGNAVTAPVIYEIAKRIKI